MNLHPSSGSGATKEIFFSKLISLVFVALVMTYLPLGQVIAQSNEDCLECHSDPELTTERDGREISLYFDEERFELSPHASFDCTDCHSDLDGFDDFPHEEKLERVDCGLCHDDVSENYNESVHGQLANQGEPEAPVCYDCHGGHDVLPSDDPDSRTYTLAIPGLCAECHREGHQAAKRYTGEQHDIVKNYSMSIHGEGLYKAGLVVTATCVSCHTAHDVRPASDSLSSVSHQNIPETCGKCHHGIYEQYKQSIHYEKFNTHDPKAPGCDECHQPHTVRRIDNSGYRMEILEQCGSCHRDITDTYFETFHGKVTKLGYDRAAKCYDCHGSHTILPPDDSLSTLFAENRVETCGKCHSGANENFAGFLAHATPENRDEYPILFYTYWFMTILLVSVMTFAGVHTLLWLPQSLKAMKRRRQANGDKNSIAEGKVYQRFAPYQRRLHILVVISFLALALTGMTLKFSNFAWAQWLSSLLGGFGTAGYIHRLGALITFFYFFAHLYFVIRDKTRERQSWKELLFGKGSMVPNMTDVREFVATVKWFIGRGPKPEYGRWTYWEKFDYFAVFWGVAIIGTTGLILWFPEFFTRFLPGWTINVATIIHSDEALLAVAFIFTIHFFNTHLRPEKFPMDEVIFTGRMSMDELRQERPREYREMVESGDLRKRLVDPMPAPIQKGLKIFGSVALVIGIVLILLIIYAEIAG